MNGITLGGCNELFTEMVKWEAGKMSGVLWPVGLEEYLL
jgi:hypothetical protein